MPSDDGKSDSKKTQLRELEKLYNDLRDEKARLLGQKAELLKSRPSSRRSVTII